VPGLHHLCFQVADRAAVDEVCATLRGWGIAATEPQVYPEYNDDYYATFFPDPDGLRLEAVARSRYRKETAARWDETRVFLNPLADLRARATPNDPLSGSAASRARARTSVPTARRSAP